MNRITSDRFGDSTKFTVLKSITEILNENGSTSEVRYIHKFIVNMHKKYKAIEVLDSNEKQYFYGLLHREFKQRCDTAYSQNFITNKKLYSHLKNYIVGFYREALRK